MREIVTSHDNRHLKLVRLLAARKGRKKENAFVVEGEDLVRIGCDFGWNMRSLLIAESAADREDVVSLYTAARLTSGMQPTFVADDLINAVSELAHPPRVIGVFSAKQPSNPRRIDGPIVLLDAVRDPGNLGTIIRSAAAFGAVEVAMVGCADPTSSKAVRSSMGAVFTTRWAMYGSFAEAFESFDSARPHAPVFGPVIGFDAGAMKQLPDAELGEHPILCFGGERTGISDELRQRTDQVVAIPQTAGIESLNVAIAASVVLYECRRGRSSGDASVSTADSPASATISAGDSAP